MLNPGDIVAGKFEVEAEIGRGGQGIVYRVRHLVTQQEWALKVMPKDDQRDRSWRERFLTQVTVGARIKSPAIVGVIDCGVDECIGPWFVMELLKGKTLKAWMNPSCVIPTRFFSRRRRAPREQLRSLRTLAEGGRRLPRLRRRPSQQQSASAGRARSASRRLLSSRQPGRWNRQLPPEEATRLLGDLLQAIGAAHKENVVHNDLKPENLFLHRPYEDPPTLKVIDFGIARLLGEGRTSTEMTTPAGTLMWMAPDQDDSWARASNDVWSIGLIAFYVLTGKVFWLGKGRDLAPERLIQAIPRASERAAQLGVAKSLPAGFDAWFARAVCREPEERFRDACEAAPPLLALLRGEALDAVAPTQLSPTLVAPPPSPRPAVAPAARPPTRRRSWSLRALLGAALTAAAAVALTLGRGCGAAAVRHDLPPPPPRDATVVPEDAAAPAIACPAGMVPMRGGTFEMGDDDPALGNPRRRVTLSPYCLDETEGTVGAFRAFWTDGHRAPTGALRYPAVALSWAGSVTEPLTRSPENGLCTWTRTAGNANAEALPLTCVDWHTMLAWCASRGARLPTEAEWEFAARGTDRRRYPWGDADPTRELLNACGDECQEAHLGWRAMAGFGRDLWAEVAPVGLFPATRPPGAVAANYRGGGLRDLAGNVWEWTADAAPTTGTPRPASDEHDPLATEGDGRVSRGGGWDDSAAVWVRAAARSVTAPGHRYDNRGGRCASAPVR